MGVPVRTFTQAYYHLYGHNASPFLSKTVIFSGIFCIPLPGTTKGPCSSPQGPYFSGNFAAITAAGLTLDNVVKTTVFLTNIADFAAVNEVYASFFEGTTYPARCAYQVSALPAGGLVEIETICQK